MGKITEALKKVNDDRISRIQRTSSKMRYVVRNIQNTKIDEHVIAFHDPSSPIAEQFKILRTNLQTLKQTKGQKAFVITSSIDGEGKTMTSINLAITMAHDLNKKSILLIDADMRKSRIARYMGLEPHYGLSELLQGKADEDNVFVDTGIPNLTVIMAGKKPKNPSELLSSKKMEQLLAFYKTKFDYIFIDTPPVMPLTDSSILGAIADGVLMVVQASRTQRDVVRGAETRLYQAKAKTLGYIMTNVEYHLPNYLYRYIHRYDSYHYYNAQRVEGGE
jgi:capsular exopolysaccharide synthesis family protein